MEVTLAIIRQVRKNIIEMDFKENVSATVCWIELFLIWLKGRIFVINNVTYCMNVS